MLEQSTVRKKMKTGTFTYNALRTKTLKERMKCKPFKLVKSNAVSVGSSHMPSGLSLVRKVLW